MQQAGFIWGTGVEPSPASGPDGAAPAVKVVGIVPQHGVFSRGGREPVMVIGETGTLQTPLKKERSRKLASPMASCRGPCWM